MITDMTQPPTNPAEPMAEPLRVTTTVQPGHRIEIISPRLPDGASVDVVVTVKSIPAPDREWLRQFLDSRTPSTKTAEEWEQFEREFQEDRDSWDR